MTRPQARLTHSSEQAEHVHEYCCGGIDVSAFHVGGPTGISSWSPKGHATSRVVLLEPEVHGIAAECLADLVAVAQDDELLVGAGHVAVAGHHRLDARADRVGRFGIGHEAKISHTVSEAYTAPLIEVVPAFACT